MLETTRKHLLWPNSKQSCLINVPFLCVVKTLLSGAQIGHGHILTGNYEKINEKFRRMLQHEAHCFVIAASV